MNAPQSDQPSDRLSDRIDTFAVIAVMRELAASFDRRKPVRGSTNDPRLARKQHADYAETLRDLGAKVEFVPSLAEGTDALFIQDTAVLLPEATIIARPAIGSRISEIDSVVQVLAQHRPLQSISEPGTLDGSDVLRIGRMIYVAESQRTNQDGIAQLREIAGPFGYEVRVVPTHDCPHLKTACTFIPPHFLVVNPARIDLTAFSNLAIFPVDEKEPTGANTLTLGRTTLVSACCPKTEKRLREAGISTRRIDISEIEKVDGGLTSLSLILESRSTAPAVNEVDLRRIQVGDAPAPAGHSSQAIAHGGLVFVSPQPPFDLVSNRPRRLSPDEQTEQAIHNLSVVLAASGSSLARVVRTTLHVADPKQIPQVEATYQRIFGAHRPARSVIVNSALPAGVLVEIEAVAAVVGEQAYRSY